MRETVPKSNSPNKKVNIDVKRPEKRPEVKQQLSEKLQILLASSESDTISQVAKETGLSRGLVLSWQRDGWASQPHGDSASSDRKEQKAEPSIANAPPTQIAISQPNQQPISNDNLVALEQPDFHQAGQGTAQQFSIGRRLEHKSHIQVSRLPEKGQGAMNDVVELRRVASALLRWWWLIILISLIAATAGFAISQTIDPVYEAKSSVIVGQSIQATSLDTRDIQASERLALSYADIAQRQPILEATNVALDLGYSWLQLRRRVSVEQIPDTQLLVISVESGSREEAIKIADEIARQLILLSPTSLRNPDDEAASLFVQERLDTLQSKIETNQERLDQLSVQLSAASTPEQKAEIQAEINNLEDMIVDWEDNYAKFLTYAGGDESPNYLAVVEKGHARRTPIRPAIRLNTIIAGAIGMVLAVGLVLLLDFLDDTLKTSDDIVQDLNLIPLGAIGQYGSRTSRERRIVANDPFSPMTESYRMIRNNIQFMSLDRPGRSIVVTSPAPGDGKSITAVNLGVVMAFNGQRTIIVDTDLRNPTLHKIFQVPNAWGLTNRLRNPEPASTVPLVETGVKDLRLLTAGDPPPNPSELLGSQRMEQLIGELMMDSDVIIFDCPPVAYIADAAVLSQKVDGVVMVVAAGRTRRDVSRQAVFNLQQAGANILGAILNRTSDKNAAYKYAYSAVSDRHRFSGRILGGLQRTWSSLTQTIRWRKQLGD
jgi:non-specific protein-tyrosine kinase